MKLRTIPALLVTLAVLAAAFLLPGLSLRLQTRAALQATRRQDATDALLNTAPVDLVKRLRLLTDPKATPFNVDFDLADRETVIKGTLRELETLRDLGAVLPEFCQQLMDLDRSLWMVDYLYYFVPETNVTADFYILRLWENLAHIVVDRTTGKVLAIEVSSSADMLISETEPWIVRAELAAWADYFGLTLTDTAEGELTYAQLRGIRNPYAPMTSAQICTGLMEDAGGNEIHFGLHFDYLGYGEAVFSWGTNPDSSR